MNQMGLCEQGLVGLKARLPLATSACVLGNAKAIDAGRGRGDVSAGVPNGALERMKGE